jgi:1-acyl-sn-glycerol-3-phosphate acyltransferase
MIPSNKNPFWDGLLYVYFSRLIRSNFSGVLARGVEHYRNLPEDRPAICMATHISWWDGLMAFFLTRINQSKVTYCMMDEKQLQVHRFLTRLGAFSVDNQNALRAAASVRYALDLLKDASTLFWIFPQGQIVSRFDPTQVKHGTAFLAKHTPRATLLPVVFRYEFFAEEKPFVLIEVGSPHEIESPATDDGVAEALQRCSQRLDEAIRMGRLEDFERLVPPRWSLNKRWEWVRLALRGRLNDFRPDNG